MDMREVASNWEGGGNPTVTEDFDDNGNRVTKDWEDPGMEGKPDYDEFTDYEAGIRQRIEEEEYVEGEVQSRKEQRRKEQQDRSPQYTAAWESKTTLAVYDKGMKIWHGEITDSTRNLIERFGAEVPDNPYDLPKPVTTFDVFVVDVADDEYHSHEEGPFWNKEDAERYAEGNPGWYGVTSAVRPKTIRIYGHR